MCSIVGPNPNYGAFLSLKNGLTLGDFGIFA